jgi:hypothetical protein
MAKGSTCSHFFPSFFHVPRCFPLVSSCLILSHLVSLFLQAANFLVDKEQVGLDRQPDAIFVAWRRNLKHIIDSLEWQSQIPSERTDLDRISARSLSFALFLAVCAESWAMSQGYWHQQSWEDGDWSGTSQTLSRLADAPDLDLVDSASSCWFVNFS